MSRSLLFIGVALLLVGFVCRVPVERKKPVRKYKGAIHEIRDDRLKVAKQDLRKPDTTVVIPTLIPDPEPVVIAKLPEPKPVKPIKIVPISEERRELVPLWRKDIYCIPNKTNTWWALVDQAAQIPDRTLIDLHFNSAGGSGFELFTYPDSVDAAIALADEFRAIYDEKGWFHNRQEITVTTKYPQLAAAKKRGCHIVISEFCFEDDRINGSKCIEWMLSKAGHKRLAEAFIRVGQDHGPIILSAGHWGDRGTPGARYKGITETEAAFALFNDIANSGGATVLPVKPLIPAPEPQPKPKTALKSEPQTRAPACKT